MNIYNNNEKYEVIRDIHEALMDIRDSVEGSVTSSTYNKLDDVIDRVYYDLLGNKEEIK